jgi:uncharacterized protein (DUF58 family)
MDLSLGSIAHRLHRWLDIDRRRAPRDQPVRLQRHRIFILPTRYGLLFAALTFVMLIGSANYGNSAGFLLTFLLIGAGLVSILHTYRNLAGLSFRAGRCEPVYCGDRARYTILVRNDGAYARQALGVQSEDNPLRFLDIEPDTEARIEIGAPTRRRGRRRLGLVTVFSTWPLGLFRAWSLVALDANCIVYPKPARYAALPRVAGDRGEASAQPAPGSDDFHGHREFQPGDPPRHIDWKAAARGQKLYTKLFVDDQGGEVWLDWDEHEGIDSEQRLARLCRAVLSADERKLRYGLRLPGIRIAPGHGERHRHACLEALALFGMPP